MAESTGGGVSTDNTGMHDDDVDMETDMTEIVNFPPNVGDGEKGRCFFLANLALFYLRMQAKMLLPASTISTLIEEFQEVCTNATSQMFSRLREELSKLEIPDEKVSSIIGGLSKENLFKK